MKLRDYQEAALAALFQFWKDHPGKHPLMVLPTGAGKTVCFATLIQRLLQAYPTIAILVLAHRKELVRQAEEKLLSVWPQAPVGVFAASLGRRQLAPITIASRDTIANALDQIGRFDLVLIDEAHNIAPGESTAYRKILATLEERNPQLSVVGFTATPYRAGQGVIYGEKGTVFDAIAYEVKIKFLIDAGYLVRIFAKAVNPAALADLSKVATRGGDFAINELDQAVARDELVCAAIDEWEAVAIRETRRRCTLFFCVSIHHAEMVSAELARRGYHVPVVHGGSPGAYRDQVQADAMAGKLIGIANVGVFTEGTDLPIVDCIAMLRPTKSLGLYIQMVGRGLRLFQGKEYALLMDFGGCIDRFGPIDTASPPAKRKEDNRTKVCPGCQCVCGFFKRRCLACGHVFTPAPFKECPACKEENAPSAAKCHACAHVFVTHGNKASAGAVLSDQAQDVEMPVGEVTAQTMIHKDGLPYLQVCFRHGMSFVFKPLYIGWPGVAGEAANEAWRELTYPDTPMPKDPAEASRIIYAGGAIRPVKSVVVNTADRWKVVKAINFLVER